MCSSDLQRKRRCSIETTSSKRFSERSSIERPCKAFRGLARGTAREAQQKRHYSIKRPRSKRPSKRGAPARGTAARKCGSKRMRSNKRHSSSPAATRGTSEAQQREAQRERRDSERGAPARCTARSKSFIDMARDTTRGAAREAQRKMHCST